MVPGAFSVLLADSCTCKPLAMRGDRTDEGGEADRVRFSVRATPNVSLVYYRVLAPQMGVVFTLTQR